MQRATRNPVYNARIPSMFHTRCARICCLLFSLLLLPLESRGDQWQSPVIQLAQKIVAATGPGAVACDLTNRSSLGNTTADEIHRQLLGELESLNVHAAPADQAAATVHVTLSENLQNYVWVAEIQMGNSQSSVVMVSLPRPQEAVAERSVGLLTVHKALLWTDDNRILDVALPAENPPHMIVLEPETVVLYELQSGRWQQQQSLTIPHSQAWPRDLRGRLVLQKDHLFDVYLPGVFCRSTPAAPLGINCRESDDPWPLAPRQFPLNAFFAPKRNFFTGVLSPGIQKQTTTSPFYTAAALPRDKYTLWLLAATDGQVHLLDGLTDQTAKLGWGSDIAGVRTGCGTGWQVLATATNADARDTVEAFEIPDREPVVVSQAVEFDGSIMALWADSDSATVLAVMQKSETGKYEAYRLSLTCGQQSDFDGDR